MIWRSILILSCVLISAIRADKEDETLTTPELIVKYGYPVEKHTVYTSDEYILEMHRIPYSSKSPEAEGKPVVFLQHGLFSTSADWIILGPGHSLGYLLADAGYDVWMGNVRGNTYSKQHRTLSTSSVKFWDFSWHEMGIYDLPAEIDYVLDKTGQEDLFYVGHSMGTTMFYVLQSEKPEYSSKIRHMISLAPIAYMEHVSNLLSDIAAYFPGGIIAGNVIEAFGVGELFENNAFTTFVEDLACSAGSITQGMCENVMFALIGYDPIQVNETALPVILAHTPAGASTKTVLHYAQEISTIPHNFYKWNYYTSNLFEYGSLYPPAYKLESIRTPITLMYCENDPFGDPTDVIHLNDVLPNVKELYKVALTTCNHQDFLWAKDVKVLVNDEIIRVLEESQ